MGGSSLRKYLVTKVGLHSLIAVGGRRKRAEPEAAVRSCTVQPRFSQLSVVHWFSLPPPSYKEIFSVTKSRGSSPCVADTYLPHYVYLLTKLLSLMSLNVNKMVEHHFKFLFLRKLFLLGKSGIKVFDHIFLHKVTPKFLRDHSLTLYIFKNK
jgi:hypothetical protein